LYKNETRQGLRLKASRSPRVPWLAIVAAVFVLLAVNLGMYAAVRSASSGVVLAALPVESARYVLATALDDRRVVAATVNNDLILLEDGIQTALTTFSYPVNGIAVDPVSGGIVAGLGDGTVALLDASLTVVSQTALSVRVVGVTGDPDGGIVVATAIGNTNRSQLIAFADLGAPPLYEEALDTTVTALARSGSMVIVGTRNARVDLRSAGDGALVWENVLKRPISALAVSGDGASVAAGDERGNLSLLDGATGEIRWTVNVSNAEITSLIFDPGSGNLIAGDEEGGLFALSPEGAPRFAGSAGESPVEAILTGGARLIAIPRDGSWQSVDPDAFAGSRRADRLRTLWAGLDLGLAIAAGGGAVSIVPAWRAEANRRIRAVVRARGAYLFVLPSLALIAVFGYYPIGMALWYSVTNASTRNATEFIGLANYREILFDDFYFRTGIGNMLLMLLADIVKVVTVPLLAAELVFRMKNRVHRYIYRTVIVGSAVVPGLVLTLLWRLIYAPNIGLLDQILGGLGLKSQQRAWLGDERTALWAIVGTGFPFLSSFAFLIYLGGLLIINTELYDAAEIDGANWVHRFFHIDVPLLIPQFRLLLFFTFAGAVQSYATTYIMTRGGPGYSTYVPALQMYLEIAERGRFGYASAIGIVLVLVVIAFTVPLLRFRRAADTVQA
jgi:ABC-type sugar transport system permease subunit